MPNRYRIVADVPLSKTVADLLRDVKLLPWSVFDGSEPIEAEGIFTAGHPSLTGTMLDRVQGLRVISNFGVGVDHIDVRAAAERGIPVGNTPGVLDGATADLGFALLMAAARRICEGSRLSRGPAYKNEERQAMLGREVHGANLGIVGMGNIGFQVARRARGFDMQVAYHNRTRRRDVEAELSVSYLPLRELMSVSDFVMLCVPLTDSTRGLIGERELRWMQPTATLINIARGAVVQTDAVTHALREGHLFAAALDVTDPEPLPPNHPLLKMNNVIITPHLGSATTQTRMRMAELAARNLMAGLERKPLICQITE